MPTINNQFRRRSRILTAVAAVAATAMLTTGPAFAHTSQRTLQPGEVVDLYTFTWFHAPDFTVSFFPNGGMFNSNIPTVSGNQLTVTETPLSGGGYSDKLQFTMPNLNLPSGSVDALITVGGGAVATRFHPVQPPIQSGYGLNFQYDSTPVPVNDAPEVPFAGALPLALLGLAGGAWLYRARRTRSIQ